MATAVVDPSVNGTEQTAPAASDTQEAAKKPYFRPGQLMTLDPAVAEDLKKTCEDGVAAWISGSDKRLRNLKRWNDMMENVVDETFFPWEGASTLHLPLVATHVVTLHSVMARSILTVDPLWYGKSLDPQVQEKIPQIETALTYKAKGELNVIQGCRDVIYTTARDGLGWLQVTWCEESTPVETVIRVESAEEFQAEFPTPEDAGMDKQTYQEMMQEVQIQASAESPYEVPVKYDRVDYKGPKVEVVEEADMVRAPYTASRLEDCRVYGKRFYQRLQTLQERADNGELWTKSVSAYVAKAKSASRDSDDTWKASRERIEGVSVGDGEFSDERENFELIVRYRMPGEKRESKFICTYSHEQKMLLGVVKYPYLRDCYIPFRIMSRPGRMAGMSVPEILEDLNREADTSIQYEINSDSIEMAPLFVGKKATKGDFDPAAEENRVAPGTVWWMDDPASFKSMEIMGGSKQESAARRQEIMRYAEMRVGPTQLLSGRESPTDPNAPGNKTIALIQQSNMRIEDYISEFRIGFDLLGDMLPSLYYQFGDNVLEYEGEDKQVMELSRADLRGMPKMVTHGVTANLNPDIEFAKAMQWFQLLMPDPMVGGRPVAHRELLNMLMTSGRLANKDKLLPPAPQVEQAQQAQMMAEAQKQVLADLAKKGLLMPPPQPGAPLAPPVGGPGNPPPAMPPATPSAGPMPPPAAAALPGVLSA